MIHENVHVEMMRSTSSRRLLVDLYGEFARLHVQD